MEHYTGLDLNNLRPSHERTLFSRPLIPLALWTVVIAWYSVAYGCFGYAYITITCLVVITLAAYRLYNGYTWQLIPYVIVALCFLVCWLPNLQSRRNTAEELAGSQQWIEGEIHSCVNPLPYANERQSVLLVTGNGTRILMNMRVAGLAYGDTIRVFGSVDHPEKARNPGGFDPASWAAGLGAMLIGDALRNPVVQSQTSIHPSVRLMKIAWQFRLLLEQSLFHTLPPLEASTLCALLLGDRSMLDDGIKQNFRDMGLSHLLVVSGTHLTMIIAPLQWVIGSSGAGKKRKVALQLCLMAFIGMATGGHPSVLRAILMSSFALVGRLSKRHPDGVSHLAACVVILLISTPWLVWNLGFQVSVAATAGILLLARTRSESGRTTFRRTRSAARLTMSAQVVAWPVIVMGNASIPLLSLPCNLLLMPAFCLLLPLTLLLGLAGIWVECTLLSDMVIHVLGVVTSMAEFAAGRSFAQLVLPFWRATASAAILLFLSRIPIRRAQGKRIVTWLACALAVLFLVQWTVSESSRPDLLVVFADVGQGDSTILITKDRFCVVVDAGTEKAGSRVVLPILGYFGISRPDICIATHGHDDHAAGFFPLLAARGSVSLALPVESLYPATLEDEPDLGPELERQAHESGVNVLKLRQGDQLETSGGIRIEILNPIPSTTGENERSIVLHITCGTFSMLIMGDAGHEAEARMLEEGLFSDVDVLRVGHHGSSGATSRAMLAITRPEISVISVGYNQYGHPSDEALERLSDAGSDVYRTDRSGALILQIRKDRIRIEPYAGGRFH